MKSSSATFATIPAGEFSMGSPTDELNHIAGEETQHFVTLTRPFLMATTEVTQGQWKAMSGGINPASFSVCGDDCPVEQVDWYATLAYANALSVAAQLDQCYTLAGCTDEVNGWQDGTHAGCTGATFTGLGCTGYRLPTEAEWEYAYRAGSVTAYYNGPNSAIDCSFDENLDAIGWYCHNGGGKTHPVALKSPNAWGLFDMAGNVAEWTWDAYGQYPGTTIDYLGPATGNARVLRGGSWVRHAGISRAARRRYTSPDVRYDALGFRLVRSVP